FDYSQLLLVNVLLPIATRSTLPAVYLRMFKQLRRTLAPPGLRAFARFEKSNLGGLDHNGRTCVSGCPIPQSTRAVIAPTAHFARGHHCAGVRVRGLDE